MPDSAPQSQEQPPQVPRPPQNSAVVQNFALPERLLRSLTNSGHPEHNQIEVVLVFCSLVCTFACYLAAPTLVVFIQFVVPFISFGILRLVYSILYV